MISCAVTTSVLGCLATLFLFWRYIWFLDLTHGQKGAFFILFLLAGCIPALTSYAFESVFGQFFAAYRYFLYFLFVFCIILFTATVLRDAIWTVVYSLGQVFKAAQTVSPFFKTVLVRLNIILLVFSFFLHVLGILRRRQNPCGKNGRAGFPQNQTAGYNRRFKRPAYSPRH